MTNQQIADELLQNWQQLWRLPPSERLRRIDEIADAAYEDELRLVAFEMSKPELMAA